MGRRVAVKQRQYKMLVVVGLVLTFWCGFFFTISNLDKVETSIPHSTTLKTLDSPILIQGDGNFTGYPGNGSKADPFRIENLTIDGAAGSYCIWIEDVTVHFIINNCTVFNAVSGIFLRNLTFGQINGCVAHDTTYGFDLNRMLNGTITNNSAYANLIGFALLRVNHTTLLNNSANNNVVGDHGDGIELNLCWYNDILNNTLNNNKHSGIYFLYSHYNTIRGNTLLGDGVPWEEYQSSNNTFEDNIAEWPEDEIGGFQLFLVVLSLLALSIMSIRKRYRMNCS